MKSKADVYLDNSSSFRILILMTKSKLRINNVVKYILAILVFFPVQLQAQVTYSKTTDDKELRSALIEFIKYAQPLIESALSTDDDLPVKAKKELLTAKINVSSALNLSLFHEPPIYSLMDTWILLHQINDCTSKNFSPEFEKGVEDLIARLSDIFKYKADALPFKKSQSFVEEYALLHPVSCMNLYRDSPLPKIANLLEAEKGGLVSKINDVTEQIDVLNFKMNYWMEYLPRQMRWQMELLSYDFFDFKFEDSLSITDLMISSHAMFEEAEDLMIDLPFLIDTTNLQVNEMLQNQMIEINTMMSKERQAFLYGLGRERSIAMDSLLNHLKSWKVLVENVQVASMSDIDHISGKVLSTTSKKIDRLIQRITILMILFCITIIAAVLILRFRR